MALAKKKTVTKKSTVIKEPIKLINKANETEINEIITKYWISKWSIATYNKCFIKDWIIVANKWISVLFKNKDWLVYTATNWNKVDSSLEFIWAVQNYKHPEPIVFIL